VLSDDIEDEGMGCWIFGLINEFLLKS
jgi:hypothetical protein